MIAKKFSGWSTFSWPLWPVAYVTSVSENGAIHWFIKNTGERVSSPYDPTPMNLVQLLLIILNLQNMSMAGYWLLCNAKGGPSALRIIYHNVRVYIQKIRVYVVGGSLVSFGDNRIMYPKLRPLEHHSMCGSKFHSFHIFISFSSYKSLILAK